MQWIYDLSYEELKKDLLKIELVHYSPDQIFYWLYRKEISEIELWTNITKKNRGILQQLFDTHLNKIIDIQSDFQGTKKFLIELNDRQKIESVLIKEKDHYTACLSSQAGCPLDCDFCATGKMGFVRNLCSGEILSQLLLMKRQIKAHKGKLNVVFMGMGEPLLNYKNLVKALEIITSRQGMGISPRNITLSTAGILEKIKVFEKDFPNIKISFSLNAPDEDSRKKLMPISKNESLYNILDYFRKVPRKHRITFEYILLKGVNDSLENAQSLIRLLKGITCKINLIPYNTNEKCFFKTPDRAAVNVFADFLHSQGFTVLVRWSKGRNIQSACGQLAVSKNKN